MSVDEEEYELVPLSPLRKMEKRLERVEKGSTSQEMMKELIDVVKTNQQIVDDMVKINSEIINKIADLSASVSSMVAKMDEFMSRIEVEGGIEEGPAKSAAEVVTAAPAADARLDRLEKRINSLILATMAKNKTMLPRPASKKPA
jgi:uncharacterized coiled-coil protein SlyX